MNLLTTILLSYFAGFIGLQVLFFVSVFILERKGKGVANNEPMISILIAARNEEKNIISCLQSIIALDYKNDHIEVLIGNDNSTDNTENLVQEFIAQNTSKIQLKLYKITTKTGKAKAKANVLAQLAYRAKGAYFFVTDADIIVNKNWIKGLLYNFSENVGIASGTTVVKSESSTLQKYDWLYFSSLLQAISNLGIPVTAVGNNMAIKREAYFATGGYEQIDFSVTEDLALYKAVRKQGYDSRNVMDTDTLNFTQPAPNYKSLLHQRKRWLTGALGLNIFAQMIMIYYALYVFVLVLMLCLNWKLGILIFATKYSIQLIHIIALSKHLKLSYHLIKLLGYEFQQILFNIILTFYYILPLKFLWKGREY